MVKYQLSDLDKWGLITLVLFLLLLPLARYIDFPLNDDWVYYQQVQSFLQGNLTLDPYIAPTFYAQGFLGALFSKLFGLTRLPILTLLISCLCFFVFGLTILKFFKKNLRDTFLVSVLFFFNPIMIYSTWGFMTEVYFLFFFLLSIYYFLKYEQSKNKKDLAWVFLVCVIGLFIRQTALVIPLSIALYFFYKKRTSEGALALLLFGLEYYYLQNLFPQTYVMLTKSLQFQHLIQSDYVFALIYGILIMTTAFLLPLVWSVLQIKKIKPLLAGVFIFLFIGIYYFLNVNFKPQTISWGEFPYFENTFERTGFYPRGLSGTKYYFKGNFDLYRNWDLIAKLTVAVTLAYLLISKRLKLNIFLVLFAVYLFLMLMVETFYDRYLLILIAVKIFYLLSYDLEFSRFQRLLIGGFGLFLVFLSYQFSLDFLLVNKYVWHKSEMISNSQNIDRSLIHGTNAWKLSYRNISRVYAYNFTYDHQSVNEKFKERYELVEEHEIKYPFNLFVKPVIYLYKMLL